MKTATDLLKSKPAASPIPARRVTRWLMPVNSSRQKFV